MDWLKEHELVDALYDAALGHDSWEQIGHRFRDYLGGKTLMLSTHDPTHSAADVVLTQGLTPRQVLDYRTFAAHDLWALGALKRRIFGKALTSTQLVDDTVFLRSFIYNEWLRPDVDARYVVGALLPLNGGGQSRGGHGAVGVHRPHDARDFTLEDAERLNRLLPHLRRALEVRQRLRGVDQREAAAHAALDQLSLGVMVIAASGRLLHVNAAGEALLRAGDGLARTPDGLRASNAEDDRRLQLLIAELRQRSPQNRSPGGHLRVRRPSGRRAYAVMLTPAGPGLDGVGGSSGAVIAFVSDPAEKIVAEEAALANLFGFPPAEARLVLALMAGQQLPDIARLSGVSYNTARTLLARAMGRTETRSQVELAMLVARTLGGVAPAVVGQ